MTGRLALMVLCLIWIAGCSTIGVYQEPKAGPTAKARLVVSNPNEYYGFAYLVDSKTCAVQQQIAWISGGKEVDTHRVDMIDAKLPQEGIVERVLPAEVPLIIGATGLPSWKAIYLLEIAAKTELRGRQPGACKFPQVSLRAGAQYEFSFIFKPGVCSVEISELSLESSGIPIRTPISIERDKQFSLSNNGVCQ